MVVVYHVTIVATGHGLLKKFWPMVIGCVLRTEGSSLVWHYADPLTSLELLNFYLTLVMRNDRFCLLCHSCTALCHSVLQVCSTCSSRRKAPPTSGPASGNHTHTNILNQTNTVYCTGNFDFSLISFLIFVLFSFALTLICCFVFSLLGFLNSFYTRLF